MICQQLFDPESFTYSYVLASAVGREALIIDPVYEQVDVYLSLLERLRLHLRLVKAFDTHLHADHITGLGALRDATRCVTVMGEKSGADVVSIRLADNETIELDHLRLTNIHTPGHTDDSYCLVMDDRVFTGDTLLIGGTGRTDFRNSDPHAAYESLFKRVLTLADNTLVFPAHDYNGNTVSTIAWERANNPRLQVGSAQEYAAIMGELDLPDPKLMDVAVPANRSIGRSLRQYVRPEEELSASQCMAEQGAAGLVLVDLRESTQRRRDGAIPGSVHLPYNDLAKHLRTGGMLPQLVHDHPDQVVFYCAFGERSAMAVDSARRAGLVGIKHLAGGLAAWLRAGGAIVSPD